MKITIDGQTITLTPSQAQQFRTAILKETGVPKPKHAAMSLYCKPQVGNTYPMVIGLNGTLLSQYGITNTSATGRDFSKTEIVKFVKDIKAYAKLIWPDIKF